MKEKRQRELPEPGMQLKFSYAGQVRDSMRDLIANLPGGAIAKPTRSTVPLLRYWRKAGDRLIELAHALGFSGPTQVELAFEYPTPVRAGRGKASYTDLMIMTADQSIAIEAKYTEPPYPSVKQWLGLEPTENRTKVIRGWLNEISKVAGKAITVEEVGRLPYQLIHRTASVCCAPGRLRTVVYQVFGEQSSDHYSDTLRKFSACLGVGPPMQLWVHACPYVPTDAWQPWHDARESTESAESVRVALLADASVLPAGTFTRITN